MTVFWKLCTFHNLKNTKLNATYLSCGSIQSRQISCIISAVIYIAIIS